jgi:glucose-6-phosphate 1-dehydrogenase
MSTPNRQTISFGADAVRDEQAKVLKAILDVWKALPTRTFPNYAAGTWGPKEADELRARDRVISPGFSA